MRNLNFHHLYYFWTVAKVGNLTRAAKQLHVSQSALSHQIKLLESQLNQQLFDRNGRTLDLTATGFLVLEYAESIFSLGGELISMLEGGELQSLKRLRVGAESTLSRNFQENFLKPVINRNDVRLLLHSASLSVLMEMLEKHQLDIVLSNRAVASDVVSHSRCQLLAENSVCILGEPSKVFEALEFPDGLTRVKVLVPGPDNDVRIQFDMYCAEKGIEFKPYAEVDDMAMLRLLARDSGGVSVLPEVVVQDELRSGVLKKYYTLESVTEKFYAISLKRHVDNSLIHTLLN